MPKKIILFIIISIFAQNQNNMRMKKVVFLCCIACLCFACKTAEKSAKEPKAKKEKTQSLEERAAQLACDCIQELKEFNQDSYIGCISQGLVAAMEEFGNPEEYNNFNVLQAAIKKVGELVPSVCKEQIKAKQSQVSDKYGSPNVKQKLVNQDMFLITEFSADSTYGYTADNPIMVGGGGKDGVQNEKRYLNALAGPLGLRVMYKRLNSCCMFYTKNGNDLGDGKRMGLLDVYEVIHDSMEEPVILYINMYDSDVLKVPVGGFTLKK